MSFFAAHGKAMTSQVAFQDNMAVRVKTERDVHPPYCTGTRGKLDSLQLRRRASNSEGFNHARHKIIFEEQPEQGREVLI